MEALEEVLQVLVHDVALSQGWVFVCLGGRLLNSLIIIHNKALT